MSSVFNSFMVILYILSAFIQVIIYFIMSYVLI